MINTTKSSVWMICLFAFVGGCTREVPANSPCEVNKTFIQDNPTAAKVQGTVVEGSTWVWNETKQAWEWLTSEENKERLKRAWESTKETASEVYDKAVKTYNEHK